MLTDKDYAELFIKSKGYQRKHIVDVLFGGQEALAKELRVTRQAVNQAIWSKHESGPVEEYVLARIRERRPDFEKLWQRPWKAPKTDRMRREILKVAAALAALGLLEK